MYMPLPKTKDIENVLGCVWQIHLNNKKKHILKGDETFYDLG